MTHFWYDPSEKWAPLNICDTLDEAVAACKKAIAYQLDGGSWSMDNEELEQFVVGTITHRNAVHSHVGTAEECEALDIPTGEEVWTCELEEVTK